jgi:hypothetical protein
MRAEVTVDKLRRFIEALGNAATGPGRVYLTGAATALLEGWRAMSVDLDLKMDPARGLVDPERFRALYAQVIPQLIRYPRLDRTVMEKRIDRALARP